MYRHKFIFARFASCFRNVVHIGNRNFYKNRFILVRYAGEFNPVHISYRLAYKLKHRNVKLLGYIHFRYRLAYRYARQIHLWIRIWLTDTNILLTDASSRSCISIHRSVTVSYNARKLIVHTDYVICFIPSPFYSTIFFILSPFYPIRINTVSIKRANHIKYLVAYSINH